MTRTRRQFLASVAGATAAGTLAANSGVGTVSAGQAPNSPVSSRVQPDSAWPMYAADPQNTGYSPEVTGPQSDVGPAWEFDTDGQISAAPAVVDGTVYVGSRDGNVYALSSSTGDEQWRFDTGSDVRSAPAVVDGTLYVGTQASVVYAVDTEGGDEQWRFGTEGSVRSAPTVVDDTVYVGSQDDAVYAIDVENGTERWQFETGFWVESSPAVADGVVYAGSDDGNVYAIEAETGEELWSFSTADRVPGSPTVVDNVVYVGSQDGSVYAIDTEEGEGLWSFFTGGSITSSPAVAEDTVYVGSRNHELYAIDIEEGEERWTFDTGRQITSSPAVAGDTVYVASESHAVFGVDTEGEELWSFDTGRPISAAPAVTEGAVYVGGENRTVYGLEDDLAPPSTGGAGAEGTTDATAESDNEAESSTGFALPDLRDFQFLLLPASIVGFATLIVGGYYALNRAGVFDPIESASETYGDGESSAADGGGAAGASDGEQSRRERAEQSEQLQTESPEQPASAPAESTRPQQSQLWGLVVDDVINRAAESETTAIQDFVVTKHLDRETLSAPVLVYEIQSVRDDTASIRLTEPIVNFHDDSRPMGDGWHIEDGKLVYETVVDPGETVTTLVGRPDCPAERADELLEKPAVSVETQK